MRIGFSHGDTSVNTNVTVTFTNTITDTSTTRDVDLVYTDGVYDYEATKTKIRNMRTDASILSDLGLDQEV